MWLLKSKCGDSGCDIVQYRETGRRQNGKRKRKRKDRRQRTHRLACLYACNKRGGNGFCSDRKEKEKIR